MTNKFSQLTPKTSKVSINDLAESIKTKTEIDKDKQLKDTKSQNQAQTANSKFHLPILKWMRLLNTAEEREMINHQYLILSLTWFSKFQ